MSNTNNSASASAGKPAKAPPPEPSGEKARNFIKTVIFSRFYKEGKLPVEFVTDEKIYQKSLTDSKLFLQVLEAFEHNRQLLKDVLPPNDYAPAKECGYSIHELKGRLIKILGKYMFPPEKWLTTTYSHEKFLDDIAKTASPATVRMMSHMQGFSSRQIEHAQRMVGDENFPYLLCADPHTFSEVVNWTKKAGELFQDFSRAINGVRINEFFTHDPEFRNCVVYNLGPQHLAKMGSRIFDLSYEALEEMRKVSPEKAGLIMEVLGEAFNDVYDIVPKVLGEPYLFRSENFVGFIKQLVEECRGDSVDSMFRETLKNRVTVRGNSIKEALRKAYAKKTGQG